MPRHASASSGNDCTSGYGSLTSKLRPPIARAMSSWRGGREGRGFGAAMEERGSKLGGWGGAVGGGSLRLVTLLLLTHWKST